MEGKEEGRGKKGKTDTKKLLGQKKRLNEEGFIPLDKVGY